MTYTNRAILAMTALTITPTPDFVDIRSTESDGFRVPVNEKTLAIKPGTGLLLEVTQGSTVAGLALASAKPEWLFRKTDAVLEKEHAEFVAESKRKHGWV